ncbi:MAG: oligoendopeptidase F [Waddliaceae bacterium]
MIMQSRDKVPQKDCWNVEALYQTLEDWKEDLETHFPQKIHESGWPELSSLQGKLEEGPATLKNALDHIFAIDRRIRKLYTYAHLKRDEDITNSIYQAALQMITDAVHKFAEETAWFEPELLSLPQPIIDAFLSSPELKEYHFHLEKIFRIKPHILPSDQEKLLAIAGKTLEIPQKTFSAINNADFLFSQVSDSKGRQHDLTHASYGVFIRDYDRVLRKNAFQQYSAMYKNYENTLGELINGQVQCHLFTAKARRYSSCLEAALSPHNIDVGVYHSLVKAVNDHLPILHRYVKLRKKILGVDALHLYDMYVPLTKDINIKMPYEKAEEVVIESVAPLGDEYQETLRKGLRQDRWVDRYENKNKASGAYSSGCSDSMPYILMNYTGLLRDVFTLSHEAGHSMHSLLSYKNQPYHYGHYPIFLAEVASTFNEDLLTRFLIERSASREEKIFLINQKIEDIRSTFFRQTMFAEFELRIHHLAETGVPLTPTLLKEEFYRLNAAYFGEDAVIDEEIAIEWARVPHFYYTFYVYQYATGMSAAIALSDRVVSGGKKEREEYLSFLKSGCSRYPIDQLQMAGVDMRNSETVEAAIRTFSRLIDQLEELLLHDAS